MLPQAPPRLSNSSLEAAFGTGPLTFPRTGHCKTEYKFGHGASEHVTGFQIVLESK